MASRRLVRLGLGLAILVAVVAIVDPTRVAAGVAAADLRLAIPAVLGLTAAHAVMAVGWRRMVVQRGGPRLSLATALRAHYAAQGLGSVTPGNLGSDVHRAAALRQAGQPWTVAVEPLVVQRATSYLALSLLAAIGLAILSSASDVSLTIVLIGSAAAAGLLVTTWLVLAPVGPMLVLRARVLCRLGDPDAGFTPHQPWPVLATGLLCGTVFHAGSIGLTWLVVVAVDPTFATWPILAALAVARLSLAVPISPSGLGVQEGTLMAITLGMRLAPEPVLAAMLVARVSTLLVGLLGALLLLGGMHRVAPHADNAPSRVGRARAFRSSIR